MNHFMGWNSLMQRGSEVLASHAGTNIVRLATLLLAGLMVGSCAAPPRRQAPPLLVARVVPPGFPANVRFIASDRNSYLTDAEPVLRGVQSSVLTGVQG